MKENDSQHPVQISHEESHHDRNNNPEFGADSITSLDVRYPNSGDRINTQSQINLSRRSFGNNPDIQRDISVLAIGTILVGASQALGLSSTMPQYLGISEVSSQRFHHRTWGMFGSYSHGTSRSCNK